MEQAYNRLNSIWVEISREEQSRQLKARLFNEPMIRIFVPEIKKAVRDGGGLYLLNLRERSFLLEPGLGAVPRLWTMFA